MSSKYYAKVKLRFAYVMHSTEMTEFQKIVSGFVQHMDNVSKEVEKEKMKVKIYVLQLMIVCIYIISNQIKHLSRKHVSAGLLSFNITAIVAEVV